MSSPLVSALREVIQPRINLELPQLTRTQLALGQHPLDGPFNHFSRSSLQQLGEGKVLNPARIAGMPVITLLFHLLTGDRDLLGINHNHKITSVRMWGELRLMFSPQ